MKKQSYELMLEAVRRWLSFHLYDSLDTAWVGLGTKKTYLPALEDGLMEWVNGEPTPRAPGWLKLTRKGQIVVLKMLKEAICPNYDISRLPNIEI